MDNLALKIVILVLGMITVFFCGFAAGKVHEITASITRRLNDLTKGGKL